MALPVLISFIDTHPAAMIYDVQVMDYRAPNSKYKLVAGIRFGIETGLGYSQHLYRYGDGLSPICEPRRERPEMRRNDPVIRDRFGWLGKRSVSRPPIRRGDLRGTRFLRKSAHGERRARGLICMGHGVYVEARQMLHGKKEKVHREQFCLSPPHRPSGPSSGNTILV